MTPDEIIKSAAFDGLTIALSDQGMMRCAGDQDAVKRWLPTLRENKAAIVGELHRQRCHKKVLAMLGNRKYAVLVENDTTDPVIATCAIRGIATFELKIPRHSYDGMVLLELLEKHSTESRPEPSQSSGDVTTSPSGNEARLAHPGRRAT